jgi:hypothetical protein
VEIKNEPEVLIETVKQSTKTHTNDMEKSDSEDDTPTENKTVDSEEYLSWRPDINTQEPQLNDEDDDDDGTKLGFKKLNESRLDSIRMKSLVTSDFNKVILIGVSCLLRLFDIFGLTLQKSSVKS